jgi:hypothetical protein
MTSKMQEPLINTQCPTCQTGLLRIPETQQEWHLVCSECDGIHLAYLPMSHQADFHKDPAKYRMFAGGKNSHSLLLKNTSQIQGNSKGLVA